MPRLLAVSTAAISLISNAYAFPWLADAYGYERTGGLIPVDGQQHPVDTNDQGACPLGHDKPSGAAPYSSKFPYTGARDGRRGTGKGLVRVPAEGDEAHYFRPPGPGDQRGPCPGLNTAANHNFISHNGITTHSELVTGLQNLYNVGYDFASFAATLGISQVGNISTETISIGDCGLSIHGAIEGDSSLTRTDQSLSPTSDSHSFNSTLFSHMASVCNNNFDQAALAKYRALRYDESRATNPHFFFGPKCLLIFGASSFLYELMPSYNPESSSPRGSPTLEAISSFFGAVSNTTAPSGISHVSEQIPFDWVNRPTPYTLRDFAANALHTYLAYPRELGENTGSVENWRRVADFGIVRDGWIPEGTTDGEAFCHLWNVVVEGVPGPGGVKKDFNEEVKRWIRAKMEPLFEGAGCW